MSFRPSLKINPDVITWAIKRSGKTDAEINKKFPKVEQWIDGTYKPTFKQLESFCATTHINLCDLYSEVVPNKNLPIADFRTISGRKKEPSPELYDTIMSLGYRQDWLTDYFQNLGCEKIDFVGSITAGTPIIEAVKKTRNFLKLELDWAFSTSSVHEAFKTLRDKLEEKRITVIVNSVVNDNTSRKLDLEEFRGFVLADSYAPFIFINGRDAKAAQLFTLVHELVHLGLSETGVVEPNENNALANNEIETFCDKVTAEFLVPKNLFLGLWNKNVSLTKAISAEEKRFKTSFVVCARKAYECDLISSTELGEILKNHQSEVSKIPVKKGRGDYYRTKGYKIGKVFGSSVFEAVQQQLITYTEAFNLTGFNSKTFDRYFKEYA